MSKPDIKVGDRITIAAMDIKVTGDVVSCSYYRGDGWDIELDNANVPGGWSHWKQWQDGGRIVEINGKEVISNG